MSIRYPMQLQPIYKDYLWGGNSLCKLYCKESNLPVTAESWELSCHQDGLSIVKNGAYKGQTLYEVLEKHKEFIGTKGKNADNFPVLVKFIDAGKDLSIQVHPSDETAIWEQGEAGKAEMWYIVKAEPHAFIYYGLKEEISEHALEERAKNGTICEVLNKVYVKENDVFYILPGTIHALGKGMVVAEVQQSSNTTFRVFDYMRKDKDGNLRPLHIGRAKEVINYEPIIPEKSGNNNMFQMDNFRFHTIFECNYFKVSKVNCRIEMELYCDSDSFHGILVLKGRGKIILETESISFKEGESIYIPSDMGVYKIIGECEFLLTRL